MKILTLVKWLMQMYCKHGNRLVNLQTNDEFLDIYYEEVNPDDRDAISLYDGTIVKAK